MMDSRNGAVGWDRFFEQVRKDARLWFLCVALLTAYRLGLIWALRDRMGASTGLGDLALAFLTGLRFDARIAGDWIMPLLAMSVLGAFVDLGQWADRVRIIWGSVFACLVLLLFPVGVLFFREFDDQFNHWIFGAVYDDLWAVVKTVNHEHPLGLWLSLLAAGCAGMVWVVRRWLRTRVLPAGWWAILSASRGSRGVVTVLVVLLLAVSTRGSLGRRPVQRKDAAVTADEFLNKCALNPFMAIYYSILDHRRMGSARGLKEYLRDGDVRGAAKRLTGRTGDLSALDDYFRHQAMGHEPRPRHVFVIVMESYGVWAMQERYAALRATEGLRLLAADGLRVEAFLPASDGSMTSLASVLSGLPHCGVPLNYHASSRVPYPTSLPAIFKRLGYRTRFFFSGYLSWERVGEFCKNQGFDEVVGGGQMQERYVGNEWGVHDADLFDYVRKHVDAETPSLNVIVTSSFHPPFSVDLDAAGFPLKAMPESFASLFDDPKALRKTGHWWYADQAMARFLRGMSASHAPILAAVTGDHYNRAFIPRGHSLYEKIGVPLVLYGPEVLNGLSVPEGAAGSHSDIPATLVDLCAPAGFEYVAFGSNLLKPRERAMGLAWRYAIDERRIVRTGDKAIFPLPGRRVDGDAMDPSESLRVHRDVMGTAWWRVMRGNGF